MMWPVWKGLRQAEIPPPPVQFLVRLAATVSQIVTGLVTRYGMTPSHQSPSSNNTNLDPPRERCPKDREGDKAETDKVQITELNAFKPEIPDHRFNFKGGWRHRLEAHDMVSCSVAQSQRDELGQAGVQTPVRDGRSHQALAGRPKRMSKGFPQTKNPPLPVRLRASAAWAMSEKMTGKIRN